MHIALISPGWPIGFPNGIVTYVHHLKAGFERLGHEVSVLTTRVGAENCSGGVFPIQPSLSTRTIVNAANLAKRFGLEVQIPSPTAQAIVDSLQRLHARNPVDVVEMEESFGWCGEIQPLLSMPLIVKLHGPAFLSLVGAEWQGEAMARRIEIEGRALRALRWVVAPSSATMSATVEQYSLSSQAVTMIPNPVPSVNEDSVWRQDNCDPYNILFVGRFDYRKGGDAILAAFATLAEKRRDITLTFVGPDVGLMKDSSRIVGIQAHIAESFAPDVAARIDFLGLRSSTEVQALRTRAAVTVSASRWESFGYIVAEAMIQGCPIVAFDVDGVNELLVHEQTALLAPLGNVSALAVSIARLLDSPEQSVQLGAAARRAVIQSCGVDVVARRMIDLYRRAIAAKNAARELHG